MAAVVIDLASYYAAYVRREFSFWLPMAPGILARRESRGR
jgi:hypothetical protein